MGVWQPGMVGGREESSTERRDVSQIVFMVAIIAGGVLVYFGQVGWMIFFALVAMVAGLAMDG